jgi:hypothetical protein
MPRPGRLPGQRILGAKDLVDEIGEYMRAINLKDTGVHVQPDPIRGP